MCFIKQFILLNISYMQHMHTLYIIVLGICWITCICFIFSFHVSVYLFWCLWKFPPVNENFHLFSFSSFFKCWSKFPKNFVCAFGHFLHPCSDREYRYLMGPIWCQWQGCLVFSRVEKTVPDKMVFCPLLVFRHCKLKTEFKANK